MTDKRTYIKCPQRVRPNVVGRDDGYLNEQVPFCFGEPHFGSGSLNRAVHRKFPLTPNYKTLFRKQTACPSEIYFVDIEQFKKAGPSGRTSKKLARAGLTMPAK